MPISVFISTVSDEFRDYRDQLRRDLTRQDVAVKVQEDFKALGGDTLAKLDTYIAASDAVVHLFGEMTGAVPEATAVQALRKKYPGLDAALPPLAEALRQGAAVSYTQWEAWLALLHGKALLIAEASATAPRGPAFTPTEASRAAQQAHLARLRAAGRYPEIPFGSMDELAKKIAYTAIMDLLVADKADEAARQRAEAERAALPAMIQAAVAAAFTAAGQNPAGAAPQAAEMAKLAEENALTRGAVETFLKDIGAAGAEPAEYAQRFEQVAERYRALRTETERRTNLPAAQEAERARARAAILAGDLDGAEAILRGLEARIAAVRREQQDAFEQSCRDEAGVKVERAALAKTRLRYREAAALYEAAAGLLGFDAEAAWAQILEAAVALYDQGEEFGDNAALRDAIVTYGRALALAPRAARPLDWAMTQNNLGNALWKLGERESGTAQLEAAIVAFRAALEEWTRERVPSYWATTQNNIGNALSRLGERESETVRLEEAVLAYRAALEEWTRERVPSYWATAQNNLGNTLRALGERESGTVRLRAAVKAYRAALEERTRDRVPLDWAMTQNNLGNALSTLGDRESGTARLEEAVAAYRAALEEQTRERVPLAWAMTQNNLGTALSTLGERESGTARLEEAVAAYRAALAEHTLERVPLQWGATQNNLGNALVRLGGREKGTARLEAAVAAFRAALEEWTRERVPLQWAAIQNNLGNALSGLGERESGTERLEEAILSYRAALEERTREREPILWAQTMENVALVGESLADRTGDAAYRRQALADCEAAFEEYKRAGAAFYIDKATQLRDRLRAKLTP